MVISSLIIEAYPEQHESVIAALEAIDGVEVHEVSGYNIIISLEAETVDISHDTANSITQIPGVFGTNLAYFDFAEDETIYPNGVDGEEA